MPQSPKQRLSPAQEGLIKKKTWGVSLCQTAAPAAGHEGTGNAPFPPAARRAWWAGGGSGCKDEQQSTGVNGWHNTRNTFAHIRSVWMQLLSDSKVFSERSDVKALWDRRLPNGTSTSEVHLGYCKPVILENYKWCSKSRVALCQQWGLTRKTSTHYPPQRGKNETLPYLH